MGSDGAAKLNETIYQIFRRSFVAIPYHEYWYYVVFVAGLLLISVWGSRRYLINVNAVFFVSGLAHTVFPAHVIGFWIEGQLDPVHIEIARVIGIASLAIVTCNYFLLKSSDATVEPAMLLLYTVSNGLVILNVIYTYKYPSKKKFARVPEETLQWSFFVSLLVFLVSLMYTLTKKDWGGYAELPSRRNLHLRLDFLYLFVQGILWYAFPAMLIKFHGNMKSIDGLHAYLSRVLGAYLIAMGIVSARAANFLRENDKTALLITRALSLVMVIVSMVTYRIRFPGLFQCNGNLVSIAVCVLFAVNAISGADLKSFFKQFCADLRLRNLLKSKRY